jgi:hypothetical protein
MEFPRFRGHLGRSTCLPNRGTPMCGLPAGHHRLRRHVLCLLGTVKAIPLYMALFNHIAPPKRPPDAWLVPICRPFAIGQLTGNGWIYAEQGILRFQGAWPAPGTSFNIAHTDSDVEIQIRRPLTVLVPWIAVEAILHDKDHAVVVAVPIWRKMRLLLLMTQHGFTPRLRWVWFSSSVRRARKWLMDGEVPPKW